MMINDSQDIGSPTFEQQRSLADIMNYLSLNQTSAHLHHQQQQRQYQQQLYEHQLKLEQQQMLYENELKQLQAYQLHQQQMTQPINQMLQQQLLSRFNQQNLVNLRQQQQQVHQNSLDHAAKYHRSSAALYDPSCTWSGNLPVRIHRFATYSPKVFLGGIPWDISEQTLMQIFKPFGNVRIEWPGKEQNAAQPKGYVYVIFESEKQVKQLLQACTIQDNFGITSSSDGEFDGASSSHSLSTSAGNYFYKISSKRIKEKEVEVIPWIIGDSNYIKSANQKIESSKTVFVGALHGKTTAEGLAKIMNDLFDGVVYAGRFRRVFFCAAHIELVLLFSFNRN
jgi:hypothetical protein